MADMHCPGAEFLAADWRAKAVVGELARLRFPIAGVRRTKAKTRLD